MAPRTRDFRRYGMPVKEFSSLPEFFRAPFGSGVFSIRVPGGALDLLYEDRGADVTVVSLHASIPTTVRTYPVFTGDAVMQRIKVNRLCIGDPNAYLPSSPNTGWYAGTAQFDAQTEIPKVVEHVLEYGSGRRAAYFGTSAGGFGALVMAASTPEAIAIAVNPRTDLFEEPTAFARYSEESYPGWSRNMIRDRIVTSAAQCYQDLKTPALYIQNEEDQDYVSGHMMPFMAHIHGRSPVHFMRGSWGAGHVPPPKTVIRSVLNSLGESMDTEDFLRKVYRRAVALPGDLRVHDLVG